jgi:hypothetical protein
MVSRLRSLPRSRTVVVVVVAVAAGAIVGASLYALPRTETYHVTLATWPEMCGNEPPVFAAGYMWFAEDPQRTWWVHGDHARVLVPYGFLHRMDGVGLLVTSDGSKHHVRRSGPRGAFSDLECAVQ